MLYRLVLADAMTCTVCQRAKRPGKNGHKKCQTMLVPFVAADPSDARPAIEWEWCPPGTFVCLKHQIQPHPAIREIMRNTVAEGGEL